jgi:hypothetical protein
MGRSKADWVLAEGEGALLETTDLGGCKGSTGAFEMDIRPLSPARKHTGARACREHTAWSQMFCGITTSRGSDMAGEVPQP